MRKLLILTLGVSSMLLATSPKTYINMKAVQLIHTDNGTEQDFEPTAFKWTVGHIFKEFDHVALGIEASAMLGVANDTKSTVSSSTTGVYTNAKTEMDNLYNLNLKVLVPLTDNFMFSSSIGVSRAKMISTATNYSSPNNWDNSLSYGAGIHYNILRDVSLEVDYMQYYKNLNGIEVGLGFKF
ncbi:MAG TPA: hypothetical protein ENK94_04505 [Campylobacterales bacterium]|nr:hypothetical protein [Campylobacterales bacterium]